METFPQRKKGLAACASTCRYWVQLLRREVFEDLNLRTAQDVIDYVDIWHREAIPGVLHISNVHGHLTLRDGTRCTHSAVQNSHLFLLHNIPIWVWVVIDGSSGESSPASLVENNKRLPLLSPPRSFPRSSLDIVIVPRMVLKSVRPPSFVSTKSVLLRST